MKSVQLGKIFQSRRIYRHKIKVSQRQNAVLSITDTTSKLEFTALTFIFANMFIEMPTNIAFILEIFATERQYCQIIFLNKKHKYVYDTINK